jgi:hypothetical protein
MSEPSGYVDKGVFRKSQKKLFVAIRKPYNRLPHKV